MSESLGLVLSALTATMSDPPVRPTGVPLRDPIATDVNVHEVT